MSPRPDYFSSFPGQVEALRQACLRWQGTPFRMRSAVPGAGGGVDCAGFIGAVFTEIGAIDRAIAIPPYELNHAEHSETSLFRTWFDLPAVRERVRRLEEEETHLDGDIVFPVVGRVEHHAGLRIGALVFHIARPSGWCAMTVSQLRLHASRYRLTT